MSADSSNVPTLTGNEGHAAMAVISDLSTLVITLLKGVIYKENDPWLWAQLLKLQPRVRDYVSVLGVELIVDESEGFAFLRAKPDSVDETDAEQPPTGDKPTHAKAPRLMARRQLSFPVSLLLALLRKKLAEFDARGGDTRLVLTRDEIMELLRVFLPAGSNDIKLTTQVDAHLNKIVEMGFIRRLKAQSSRDDTFEVKRILKSFVDAQWLSDFDAQLAAYQSHVGGAESADSNGGIDNG